MTHNSLENYKKFIEHMFVFWQKCDIIEPRKAPVTGRIASWSISNRREVRRMTLYELISLIIISAGVLVDLVACVATILSFRAKRKGKK